jgi:hypothetical protein
MCFHEAGEIIMYYTRMTINLSYCKGMHWFSDLVGMPTEPYSDFWMMISYVWYGITLEWQFFKLW